MILKEFNRRTLKNPPRDYQPSTGELREAIGMPGLPPETVFKAVFRPLKSRTRGKAS